ncbi:hypothetical protein Q7P37_011275 [Cladosporium fusiforme]
MAVTGQNNPSGTRKPASTSNMTQGSSQLGATATGQQLRTKNMNPDFYKETKEKIIKALNRDQCSFCNVYKRENNHPEWKDWDTAERERRTHDAFTKAISDRKSKGIHVSCTYPVFANYVPQSQRKARVRDLEKAALIEKQIKILGAEPMGAEDRNGCDDDEDDNQDIPTLLMGKVQPAEERRLDEIEPYAAKPDTQPQVEQHSDCEDEDDNEKATPATTHHREDEVSGNEEEESSLIAIIRGRRLPDPIPTPNATPATTHHREDDGSDNGKEDSSLIAIIRGRRLPTPITTPNTPLRARKQRLRTSKPDPLPEKAVRRSRLDTVEAADKVWDWIEKKGWAPRKRARKVDGSQGPARKVKVEVVKVE